MSVRNKAEINKIRYDINIQDTLYAILRIHWLLTNRFISRNYYEHNKTLFLAFMSSMKK